MDMKLYRLTLATILQRKVWVVAILWLVLLPLALPNMIATVNESLVQPARAQAVWVSLWGIALTWVFFQAARCGDELSRSGLGSYFLSLGVSNVRQLGQLTLACLTFLVPLVMIAIVVCLLGAMPGDSKQAEMWLLLNVQYGVLFLSAVTPLLLLGVALGSRLGGAVAYIVPVAMALYGLYGVGSLASLADSNGGAMLNWLYVISPHYHLADLTERLVFKHGSMVTSEFFQVLGYFAGMGLVLFGFSALYFKAKSEV